MCSKSIISKSINYTCKCVDACPDRRLEAKEVVQSKSDKTRIVARTESFRFVVQNIPSKKTDSWKNQMAHIN